jgi:dipeptidyl aminopeptidase/acylaminoacyl peptidase
MSKILLLAVLGFAAPPPKELPFQGRITIWVDDKVEHFRSNGLARATIPLPAGLPKNAVTTALTPDLSAVVIVDRKDSDIEKNKARSRLVIWPTDGKSQPFTLDGYVAYMAGPTPDGKRILFSGGLGDERDPFKDGIGSFYFLDTVTKEVTPIPLPIPNSHRFTGISPDGKAYFITKDESDAANYSHRTYLVAAGGQPREVFRENAFVHWIAFSDDGTKCLAKLQEYEGLEPDGKGGYRIKSSKPPEWVVLDVATRKATVLSKIPLTTEGGVMSNVVWSPDGQQLAYTWVPKRDVGVGIATREFKVFVADSDGGNPKEVYKTKGSNLKTLMWE